MPEWATADVQQSDKKKKRIECIMKFIHWIFLKFADKFLLCCLKYECKQYTFHISVKNAHKMYLLHDANFKLYVHAVDYFINFFDSSFCVFDKNIKHNEASGNGTK